MQRVVHPKQSDSEAVKKKPQVPDDLQVYVAATIGSIADKAAPESREWIRTILKRFHSFLKQDEIHKSKAFTTIYKLLQYGFEHNESRSPTENRTLQEMIRDEQSITAEQLQEAIDKRLEGTKDEEREILEQVAEFNMKMLEGFNSRFRTNKERMYATTVNFVSETGFHKILEAIFFADAPKTKKLAFVILKKVFKNTYEVVQQMDRKHIAYPEVFREPLRLDDQEDEQTPPVDQNGKAFLCYDFDVGNLYSYLDILSNVLRKMLDRHYLTQRYQHYAAEKKRNGEGYISYPLLLSLILKNETQNEVVEHMLASDPRQADQIQSVLMEFIHSLQTNEFLYLYSIKRYIYLKHFLLELLEEKRIAGIHPFYLSMILSAGLLANEQYQVPYDLIDQLMNEKECSTRDTKAKLAETLNELTPNTIDTLLRFVIKTSYMLAGPKEKKALERRFEEAKILSALNDPLTAIMQGVIDLGIEEARLHGSEDAEAHLWENSPSGGNAALMGHAEVEKKFSLWQSIVKQIFKWRVKRLPESLRWIENTATQLEMNKGRYFPKDHSPASKARWNQLLWSDLPDSFTFFTDDAPKWRDQIQFIEKYHRRRGILLNLDRKFRKTIAGLLEELVKHGAVREKIIELDNGETHRELCAVVKLPTDRHYQLPTGPSRQALFVGIGLIPYKKKGGPAEPHATLFLYQEIPRGFHSEGMHPLSVKVTNPMTGNSKAFELIEISLTERYYDAALQGFLDALHKWLPMPAWDQDHTQKVVGSLRDYHRLVNSNDDYGAVGEEVMNNPNKQKKRPVRSAASTRAA